MAGVPSFGGERGCRQRGSNRVDFADRRNRRRLIYRLSSISAAEANGAHRNRAWRRHSDAVARRVMREEENMWARGKRRRPVRTDRATGRVRPVGWSDRWARHDSEREVEGGVFNQELKIEFDKKKRAFREKGFSTWVNSRKINGISTKITLSDFNFANHLTSGFDK
jgi:hypothetical protein